MSRDRIYLIEQNGHAGGIVAICGDESTAQQYATAWNKVQPQWWHRVTVRPHEVLYGVPEVPSGVIRCSLCEEAKE